MKKAIVFLLLLLSCTGLKAADSFNGNDASFTGRVTANAFIGDGSLLTGITSTVSTNVVTKNYGQDVSINGRVSANFFIGDGSLLTGITASGSNQFSTINVTGTANIGLVSAGSYGFTATPNIATISTIDWSQRTFIEVTANSTAQSFVFTGRPSGNMELTLLAVLAHRDALGGSSPVTITSTAGTSAVIGTMGLTVNQQRLWLFFYQRSTDKYYAVYGANQAL